MSFSQNERPVMVRSTVPLSLAALALAGCAGSMAEAPPPPPPPPPPVVAAMTMAPPPPVYRVASGSPSVLAEYPRGTEITDETRICLEEGEQLNILGSNGQRASYEGPGCMRRSETEGGDNVGGFIFGSNSRSHGSVQLELAE